MPDTYDTETATYSEDATSSVAAPSQSLVSERTLSVAKAQKIVQAYTDNPSWLADPRTAHAANAVFGAAAKVIGMNLQLDRVNNSGEAAKTAQILIRENIKQAGEVLAKKPDAMLPDGTPLAAAFTPGNDGKIPIATNPALRPYVAALHGQHVASKDIQPKGMEILMPDGSKVPVTYNPATGSYDRVTTEAQSTSKIRTAADQKHLAALESQYTDVEKKFNLAKAAFYANRTDPAAQGAYNALFVERATKKDELEKAREAMMGKAPSATNAPAASATSAPSADELIDAVNPSGKKVRIRKSQADDARKSGYTIQ